MLGEAMSEKLKYLQMRLSMMLPVRRPEARARIRQSVSVLPSHAVFATRGRLTVVAFLF